MSPLRPRRGERWTMHSVGICRIASSCLCAALAVQSVVAAPSGDFEGVPSANPKSPNMSSPNRLTRELIESVAAQGCMPLDGATAAIPFYGYSGDGTMVPAPGDVQSPGHNVEATKTEPDKN